MALNEKVRVTWQDLEVGRELAWDIYTESGKLLLKAGHVIPNEQILKGMTKYVLYRFVKDGNTAQGKKDKRINVFAQLNNMVIRLGNLFDDIDAADQNCMEKIEHLANGVQQLCQVEPDATIAAFHLPNDYRYSVFHSLQCAIVCAFILEEESLDDHTKKMIIAGALTANVGMHKLQDQLAKQDGMLTPDQDDEVKLHPEKSVRLLKSIGVDDKIWMMTVLDHHELGDQSGYPRALPLEKISIGAKMLAVADRYGAMVTMRDYRQPIFIKDALSTFLLDKGKSYETRYALLLIKQLSIFPPGSFVKLNNGEIAIVIKRGVKNPMKPIVKAFLGPDKKRYIKPLFRECGMNNYEVDSLHGFDPNIPLNYHQIWEYT
ncbi:MAG: hypothetical protein OEY52_15910 [Gammaproteobacteria bacterium]|nr:hypothetical protein [Gammaproteobacteria bacterium]